MANRVRIDNDTVFNPETGELITTPRTGTPPSRPGNSGSDSSWAGCGLLVFVAVVGLVIYLAVTRNKDTTSPETSLTSSTSDYSRIREENPYGMGNGKVTIYKTCDECVDVQIYIDGKWVCNLNRSFKDGRPSCGDTSTFSAVIEAGDHQLTAKDRDGTEWDFRFTVHAGMCMSEKIALKDGKRTNAFGNGNGQITLCNTSSEAATVMAYIDDIYVGTFTKYYTEPTNELCGINDEAALSKVLSTGEHSIKLIDDQRNVRSESVVIQEGECILYSPKDKQIDYPYGKGNGQLTIYHNCMSCKYVRVYIDNNEYAGTLNTPLEVYEGPDCGESGNRAITKVLPAGVYRISATDYDGNKWVSYVAVKENQCKTYALENFTPASRS